MIKYDIIVSGAGIVGLATAMYLQRGSPGLRIAVVEKEPEVAAHQSSHNSGVIHSGIYYKPGSLRALNCKRGYDLMIAFCTQYGIPFDICGKIIVATEAQERSRLHAIYQRGVENGLIGLKKIGRDEARDMEPCVDALEAVWVPQAGIVDYGTVAQQYAELIRANGGDILTGLRVMSLTMSGGSVVVQTDGQELQGDIFINCSGLYSDKVAQMTGERPDLQILPFRGEYYEIIPERQYLVRNLIYPVPNPNFPFLGVHFTRMIGGGIEAGPNAVLAFRREGYSRWDVHPGELAETITFPGFRKIAAKYWRDGWAEMKRSYSKRHFVAALQRLVPDIRPEDVEPGRSGVRAMACDRAGNLLDDFLILERPHIINVCNAPSPAATASLAIGEAIAAKALKQLNR